MLQGVSLMRLPMERSRHEHSLLLPYSSIDPVSVDKEPRHLIVELGICGHFLMIPNLSGPVPDDLSRLQRRGECHEHSIS
jgi:hypothetical protein